MKPLQILWAIVVLVVGLTLSWYCVFQRSEPTAWVTGAAFFYCVAVAASAVSFFSK